MAVGRKVGLGAPLLGGVFRDASVVCGAARSSVVQGSWCEMHRQVWECRLGSKAQVPVSRGFPVWVDGQRRQWWVLVDPAGRVEIHP